MTVIQSLEKLVDTIENKGISIRSYLRPGLSRLDVQTALSSLNLTPPEELYTLYEWHDGVDNGFNAPIQLFGEHQFLPLNDAVQEYREIITYYSSLPSSINIAQCFPFASFQGDNCTIYCENAPVDDLMHPVINIYHGIAILYEDIDRMAQTVAEWFASGIYDSEPVNEIQQAAIRRRLNPRIPYRSVTL
jgi:hypothetical protein